MSQSPNEPQPQPNERKSHPLDYMAVYKRSNDPVEDKRRAREAMSKMWAHIAKVRSGERSQMAEDHSLSNMEAELESAKGTSLNPKERDALARIYHEHAKAMKVLEDRAAKAEERATNAELDLELAQLKWSMLPPEVRRRFDPPTDPLEIQRRLEWAKVTREKALASLKALDEAETP